MSFDIWDLVLFAVVSALTLGVAYMPDPRHKALIMSLPLHRLLWRKSLAAAAEEAPRA